MDLYTQEENRHTMLLINPTVQTIWESWERGHCLTDALCTHAGMFTLYIYLCAFSFKVVL